MQPENEPTLYKTHSPLVELLALALILSVLSSFVIGLGLVCIGQWEAALVAFLATLVLKFISRVVLTAIL